MVKKSMSVGEKNGLSILKRNEHTAKSQTQERMLPGLIYSVS